MATFADLVRQQTDLAEPVIAHLQRLVASWGTLSDLCFADLLLFSPAVGRQDSFVVLGQVRPTTNRTLHLSDLVGTVINEKDRPLVARGWRLGSVVEGEVEIAARNERARMVCIPVRFGPELVAVLTRESALAVGRRPGELERTYVEVFDRLARMIASGAYPFPVDEPITSETPRVGDGVVVLDAAARVEFASPNAVNALHRMGLYSSIDGLRLDEAGLDQAAVDLAYKTRQPATEEVTRDADAALVIRCVPLLDQRQVTGAIVLLRDVTELRRRDRLLLSKDAAIREVHHRVKNNLQTISSLLRLQARRLPPGEGRHALEESERRVRSIALVHEILSRDTVDQVHFNDILPSLVRMAEDLGSADRPVRITCTGEAGDVPASVATPLAVVVTELLQNAAEHAYPLDSPLPVDAIKVDVRLTRTDSELHLIVADNGVGLHDGFNIDDTASLGLSIVRGLVGTQLGGTIAMSSGDRASGGPSSGGPASEPFSVGGGTDGGTRVELVIPLDVVEDDDLDSL